MDDENMEQDLEDNLDDVEQVGIMEMFQELVADHKRILSKIESFENLVNESIELFKNGQTEMHRLIAESQSARFAASNKKKERINSKSYDAEDVRVFALMSAAFKKSTGLDTKMFSQYCNMEVLKDYGHYPGKFSQGKNTGAFDKINGDIAAKDGKGVPSFADYFGIAISILNNFKVDIPEEVVSHQSSMGKITVIDTPTETSNISCDDTRGSNSSDEYVDEGGDPY